MAQKETNCCCGTDTPQGHGAAVNGYASGCLLCGKNLVYHETGEMRTCAVCGKKSLSHATCEDGHFVCDSCHSFGAVAPVAAMLRESTQTDAIQLFEAAAKVPSVHLHGPEHHVITPLVLLTAYRNCGGRLNYTAAMSEVCRRALQVPGGTCGFWGVCGAAAGAGIYASVLLGSGPLNGKVWSEPQHLTAAILENLAGLGGPRCCKRTVRRSIEVAADYTEKWTGVKIPTGRVICRYFHQNKECIGNKCPYYPKKFVLKGADKNGV